MENKYSLKRHRNESGQGESEHQEKKLFAQSSTESVQPYSRRRSFSLSGNSISTSSVSSARSFGASVSSSGDGEPMLTDMPSACSDDSPFYQDQPENTASLSNCTVKIERCSEVAWYEVHIKYIEGDWQKMKNCIKTKMLKYIRAVGNSLGGLVKVDLSDVKFGKKGHTKLLNEFYGSLEDIFHHWVIRPKKEPTTQKKLTLNVPMFEHIRSENTNIVDPGGETNPTYSDQRCQHMIEKNEGSYKSRCQKFDLLKNQINDSVDYNTIINSGSEASDIQFKLLKDGEALGKRIIHKENKLQVYASAFGTHDGGLIFYGVNDFGETKGQKVSANGTDTHSYENIQKEALACVKSHTLWLNRQGQECHPDSFMEFYRILVVNIPEDKRKEMSFTASEYLALIIIGIKPFDGVVFKSSKGPEVYRIDMGLDGLDIISVSAKEWLSAKCRKMDTETITNGLCQMNLKFDSAVEGTNIFELPNNTRRIRERMFKISKDFPLHPEGFLSGRHKLVMEEIQGSFSDSDEGIILAEICRGEAIYLFILSRQCGLHFCMVPVSKEQSAKELLDTLSSNAMTLKTRLCKKGGCRLNLVIRTHIVGEDACDKQALYTKLHEPHPLQDSAIEEVLDSYIRMIGSFPNSTLKQRLGLEVLNVLTESQFEILTQNLHCRELWIHGLAGSGKTILAQMFMNHLVKTGEGKVLYVAENKGSIFLMRNLVRDLQEVQCMTRKKFLTACNSLRGVVNIVFDEVHHYRDEDGDWLTKGREFVSRNRPEYSENEGYMWLFVDMFQKENKFCSGIPPVHKQKSRKELVQIVRCTPTIWKKAKEELQKVKLSIPDDKEEVTEKFYKNLLEKSASPHNIVIEDSITEKPSARSQIKEFALFFQVADIITELQNQHWRADDIAVLFSTENEAVFFRQQYNKLTNETLIECTEDTKQNHCVCDSVRRFSGLDKPCVILVEPTVKDSSHDLNAFMALGISRAMVKLIIIKKQRI